MVIEERAGLCVVVECPSNHSDKENTVIWQCYLSHGEGVKSVGGGKRGRERAWKTEQCYKNKMDNEIFVKMDINNLLFIWMAILVKGKDLCI